MSRILHGSELVLQTCGSISLLNLDASAKNVSIGILPDSTREYRLCFKPKQV